VFSIAVSTEMSVDELASIVRVNAKDLERKHWFDLFDGLNAEAFGSAHECGADRPSGGYVSHVECVDILAAGGIAAVSDQVDLEEAGASIIPVCEGTDRV